MSMNYTHSAGALGAEGLRFAIVVSRFNSFITDRLLRGRAGRHRPLRAAMSPNIDVIRIPGAWEFPVTVKAVAARGNVRRHHLPGRRDSAATRRISITWRAKRRSGIAAASVGDRRSGRFRRADHQHRRAGRRPRRRQERQQGFRRGDDRHRDGESAAAGCGATN